MRLMELDWDAPGGVAERAVEYPTELGEDFLNWLRRTSAWKENPALVEHRLRRLNAALHEHRQRGARWAEVGAVATAVVADLERAAAIKAQRQANMAKARAARKAKREASLAS